MIEYKDECIGCPDGMGCLGDACPYGKMPLTYCDDCGQEDTLYAFSDTDEQLCQNCMEEALNKAWAEMSFIEKCDVFDVKEVKI